MTARFMCACSITTTRPTTNCSISARFPRSDLTWRKPEIGTAQAKQRRSTRLQPLPASPRRGRNDGSAIRCRLRGAFTEAARSGDVRLHLSQAALHGAQVGAADVPGHDLVQLLAAALAMRRCQRTAAPIQPL